MADQKHDPAEPIEVRTLSLSLTPEVGADDALVAVRVVPDGREGEIVFARSLRTDEEDDDRPVVVDPARGERLRFRSSSIEISIRDVDRYATVGSDGYAPITNTIWTWLTIGNPAAPELFRYLLAAARRIDGTHALLIQVLETLEDLPAGFIGRRERYFLALSIAEILTVALGRSVDLLGGMRQRFSVGRSLPPSVESKRKAVREIRNAFEHIEDRALGQVRGKPHEDALTVFQQSDLVENGRLTYGKHVLDLHEEVPRMLLDTRQFVYDVAVEIADGPARAMVPEVEFFGPEGPAAS